MIVTKFLNENLVYINIKCFENNCDKRFFTSTELKLHIGHKHSTERPFKCNFKNCNSSFKSLQNLNMHKKAVHLKNNV